MSSACGTSTSDVYIAKFERRKWPDVVEVTPHYQVLYSLKCALHSCLCVEVAHVDSSDVCEMSK